MKDSTKEIQFDNRFDIFKWDATCYENPKDIVERLSYIKGKRLKAIKVIGFSEISHGLDRLLFNRLYSAGVEMKNGYKDYDNLDNVLLPWSIDACEPLQFIWDDNTTLEILPYSSGKFRITENSIPIDTIDGLNSSSLDANILFDEFLDKTIEDVSIYITKTTTEHIATYDIEHGSGTSHESESTTTRLAIEFSYANTLDLIPSGDNWYRIAMNYTNPYARIPYSLYKSSVTDDEQICIVNGRDSGGTFWICPNCKGDNEDIGKNIAYDSDMFGMSIDETDADEFLIVFLRWCFDPNIQEEDDCYIDGPPSFDWYGVNYYSTDSMYQMINSIKQTILRLTNNPTDPVIHKIINRFSWYEYSDKQIDELTDDELFSLRLKRIPIAIDFYERFIWRIESMLQLPNIETISFAGP